MKTEIKKGKTGKDAGATQRAAERGTTKRASGPRTVTRSVIRRPWISEKAGRLEMLGQYVFLVSRDANKSLVADEVRRRYNVTVTKVSITNKKGKRKRYRNQLNERSAIKKAIVTLKAGDKIDLT